MVPLAAGSSDIVLRMRLTYCYWMGFEPERPSGDSRIVPGFSPPRGFIATAVELAMVTAAKWDRKLVAHLAPKRARLGESEVVGVGG